MVLLIRRDDDMSFINWVDLPNRGDERGALVAIEAGKDLPFEIKRVYYIFGAGRNISRGFHAHIALKQLAVCVSGRCRMTLDDGRNREDAWLDSPDKGILIEGLVWREMYDFSPDCVLLVLASEKYEEADYIRDYDKFKAKAAE